jgi:CheY-like chemotaxis protein
MSSIVVVDDQSTSRRVISKLASSVEAGAAVVEFADPVEALLYLREHTPDLLITDFSMPVIDGAELIRRFRDMPGSGDVPAVVITAHENAEFRRLSFEAGTTVYLSLPLNYDEFRLRSRNLLALRHAHRAAVDLDVDLTVLPVAAGTAEVQSDLSRIEILDGLLQVVSAKLVHKITQLESVYGDLQNLLSQSACPAVFIDEFLRVRRFTPGISAIYRISPSDVGASLLDLPCCLNYADIENDVKLAKLRGVEVEKIVQHSDSGEYYAVKIIPNKHRNNIPWGSAVYFTKLNTWYHGRA